MCDRVLADRPDQKRAEGRNGSAAFERVSKSMPEVEVLSVSGESWKTVKLISLEGNVLKFRVYPVRGWELTRIQVEEITEIKQMKKRHASIGALLGMTPGVGYLALNAATSHEHGGVWILFGSLIAAAGALAGLLVGSIADAMRTNPYNIFNFRTLSEAEKISVLRKIMKI
jgi:hypothetical protein